MMDRKAKSYQEMFLESSQILSQKGSPGFGTPKLELFFTRARRGTLLLRIFNGVCQTVNFDHFNFPFLSVWFNCVVVCLMAKLPYRRQTLQLARFGNTFRLAQAYGKEV